MWSTRTEKKYNWYVKKKIELLKILISAIISRSKLCILGATTACFKYKLFNEGKRRVSRITYLIKNFVCFYTIFRHTREFHSFAWDTTITRVGLQISTSTYTLHSWPLGDKGFCVACYTYCNTGHLFNIWSSPSIWQQNSQCLF